MGEAGRSWVAVDSEAVVADLVEVAATLVVEVLVDLVVEILEAGELEAVGENSPRS